MARPKNDADEAPRPTSINRSDRPQRVPINGLRDKLSVSPQEPGWHYCWINDSQVPTFEAGGYVFVTHDVKVGDRKIDNVMGLGGKVSMPGGNGVTIYLMRCTDEVYHEETQLNHDRVDQLESAMRSELNTASEGRYGKVKIGQGNPSNF